MEKNNDKERELRELEKTYKLFYEYAPLAYQALDENANYIDVNQVWLDFFGYDKEEVIGKYFGQFLAPKSRELLKSRFSHFKEVGAIQNVEHEIIKKDGIHRIISLDGRIEYDKDGGFKQTHCFFKDITKQKRIENQLRNSEVFLSNVFTSIQDGISVLDEDLNIMKVNPIMEKWYSHSMPIIGRKCYEAYHERSEQCEICPSVQALRSGEPAYEVVPKRGPNQKTIGWLDLFSFPLFDEGGGKIIGVIEHVRDITERKKVEKELLLERDNLMNILNSMEDGVYIVDSNYNLEYVNPIITKEFGRSEGKKCYKYFDDREEVCESCKNQEVLKGKTVRGEWYSAKNQKIYDLIDTPLKNVDGSVSKLAIFRDISENKKIEQELKESEERYRNAYDNADFYKDLLAHDVGNIFNNINASVQLMKIWKEDKDASEKEGNMIAIIKQQLERGASLISNVRKLSEIEEEEMSLKPIDVKKVLEKSIEDIRSRFHERETEINFKAVQEITNVVGGELLIDAFENLLINGVIHNDSEIIRLWIKLSKVRQEGKNFVKIEFKDNGLGIIDNRKKNIYERNYEKDRSTGGMGIGLSLVKNIINSYGGQVWVENRVEGDYSQGSNFIILLKED